MQHPEGLLIKGLKSKIITRKDSLLGVLKKVLKKIPLHEKDVLVITSKVVSVSQGRMKKIGSQKDFDKLVKKEADIIIGKSQVTLTVKDGIFIPWAGIDRSNVRAGYAVLWPKNPFSVASRIQKELKKIFKLRKLGIIISDSHCIPLRKGVVAMALGYAGFIGVNDLRGQKDLYGNKLKVTQQNVANMLATAAHLVMGEAAEKIPFAVISNAPVFFSDAKTSELEAAITPSDCLFAPIYPTILTKAKKSSK